MSYVASEPTPHPGWFKVMTQLMKLRVIVLLQITALCAILVHDTFARNQLIDLERTWGQTLWVMLVTVVGGDAVRWWLKRDQHVVRCRH